ncbi:MAG: response regulator [Candidatus Euphemobacter frigidus]|nr:response regulator [Candidatus Euphemobacter frigidus]MDP8276268.1 response regulator [Candidatus Euphemobacter frigidus]
MRKVLVAEDDEVSREIIVHIVEDLGLTAIQSSNGKIALEILFDNPDINLLISDIMMPELDGMMLIKIIRGKEKFANLPIIIISGVAALNELEHILELGPSTFLDKPLNSSELKRNIKELLKIE